MLGGSLNKKVTVASEGLYLLIQVDEILCSSFAKGNFIKTQALTHQFYILSL